ncbi:MAG: DNA primase large subunit PriL [Methanosarcinales archaeon]|nr:DNA primase large subunit PriL [Methanosarcinales archaeon]
MEGQRTARHGMMEEGVTEEARLCFYPFLSAASNYVEALGVTLDDLITAATFERARLRGKERVREAIREGTVRKPVIMSTAQAEMELLSYPFARILVSCIGNAHLVRRYALSEAKSAYNKLLEDSSTGSSAGTDIIYEMAQEFDIQVDFSRLSHMEHAPVQMPFVDYLRFTSNLRDKRWKLVNRGLEKGQVNLRKGEFLRVIQEAIYARISKDLPLDVPGVLCESIRKYTRDIEAELEERRKKFGDSGFETSTGFLVKDPSCFPPCITAILSNLKDGVNVPHTARFAVTAFLLNLGLTVDEIIEIYKNSPDFDEERTRYQVVHIAGAQGSTKYTAPSCSTMRTYGNCVDNDDVCEKVNHPLSYYKRRLKLKQKQKKEQQDKPKEKVEGEK